MVNEWEGEAEINSVLQCNNFILNKHIFDMLSNQIMIEVNSIYFLLYFLM